MLSTEQLNYYRTIIRRPVVTEKSMTGSEVANTYTFDVHVTNVNTLRVVGKTRRRSYRHGTGRTAARKKAMVTLADGESIDVVEMGG